MKSYLNVSILVLVLINLFLIYTVKDKNDTLLSLNHILTKSNDKIEKLKTTINNNFIKDSLEIILISDNISDTVHVVNSEGNILLLKDVLYKGSIVFRFSLLTCNKCIKEQLQIIQDLLKKENTKNNK